jgi:hypothetical protein
MLEDVQGEIKRKLLSLRSTYRLLTSHEFCAVYANATEEERTYLLLLAKHEQPELQRLKFLEWMKMKGSLEFLTLNELRERARFRYGLLNVSRKSRIELLWEILEASTAPKGIL